MSENRRVTCPYCGSDRVSAEDAPDGQRQIVCRGCHARGPSRASVPGALGAFNEVKLLRERLFDVPFVVRARKTVRSEIPTDSPLVLVKGELAEAVRNQRGAVSAKFPGGKLLGLKPDEYEVV